MAAIEEPDVAAKLQALRNEITAQRAVLIHLVDLATLRGGPDRDTIAEQLESLRFTGADGVIDEGATLHIASFARMLREDGRGNVFKMKGWNNDQR